MNTTTHLWETVEEAPKYEVNTIGEVRNIETGHILSPRLDKDGYHRYNLVNLDGKVITRFAHRLVSIAFIPNPNNLPLVNHKDEIKTNNSIENLEWCDHRYNLTYGTARERARQTMALRRSLGEYGPYGKRGTETSGKTVYAYDKNMKLINSFISAAACGKHFGTDNSYILRLCKKNHSKAHLYKKFDIYVSFSLIN